MVKTKLTKANTQSKSLRSTVPEGIIDSLELNDGDSIDWVIDVVKGEKVAVVKKE